MAGEDGFFLSTWSSLRIHLLCLCPGPPACAKFCPPAAASPLLSLVSTEGWTTRSWLGSSLACDPLLLSLRILRVPRTCVRPGTFSTGVRRPRPRISTFFKGPGLALVSTPLQRGRFVCELTGRRAHTCFQQVSGVGFVSGQCVSKHQARWSPAKGHSHPFQASTSGSHVGGAAVCRRFQSEHQVLSRSQTRSCSR